MAGAFIDHGADGMAVIAGIHAVEHHFGDRLLALIALAAGLVIQHFRQAAMLGQKLRSSPHPGWAWRSQSRGADLTATGLAIATLSVAE